MDSVPTTTRLTAGEVARALGVDIATVVDLVYRRELAGRPDPQSGRIYVDADAVEACRRKVATG